MIVHPFLIVAIALTIGILLWAEVHWFNRAMYLQKYLGDLWTYIDTTSPRRMTRDDIVAHNERLDLDGP